MIDPHVHCRDGSQTYKETIAHTIQVAEAQGVDRIFDMPNTDPPIISETDVQRRLSLVPSGKKGRYFLYVGVTSDPRQLEEAVRCFNKFPEVIGLKMFAGRSVGSLAVVKDEEQRQVYETLARLGYAGVIAVHCEREGDLKPELWNPSSPISHSLARPKQAEINSVTRQIVFVRETGFKGNLHICHVSCPESVELVKAVRGRIRVTCGVTPHHIIWDDRIQTRPEGLLFKINPPLRNIIDITALTEQLKAGEIDWIETDHAPHAIGEKLFPPYLSGFPSLYLYRSFVTEYLPVLGIPQSLIRAMTFDNIMKTFGDKLK